VIALALDPLPLDADQLQQPVAERIQATTSGSSARSSARITGEM
jgi:hypothetical protein